MSVPGNAQAGKGREKKEEWGTGTRGFVLLSFAHQAIKPFSPSQFISINLHLTLSIKNKLFSCENKAIDHTQQTL